MKASEVKVGDFIKSAEDVTTLVGNEIIFYANNNYKIVQIENFSSTMLIISMESENGIYAEAFYKHEYCTKYTYKFSSIRNERIKKIESLR